jgi:LmeA-like phospholipid-binding
MALGSPGLGENALSKVAELGISSKLDKVEDIDVDIRTDPGKLVQGQLDSVSISGKGLVMKQDLRVETLEVKIDEVAINPLSAVFGNIELKHPTDAEAEIILTEDDLNRAFSSDFIQKKFHGIKMDIEGKPMTVDVQKASIHLPGDNEFILNADFLWRESGELKKLSATAIPEIEENGYKIYLHILSAEGQGLEEGPVTAMFEQLTDLLDLRNFNIPGMSLQFRKLDAQQGRLLIHAKTQIQKIPSA